MLWRGQKFKLVDTAGLLYGAKDELESQAIESTQIAIKEADVVLFVVSWREGLANLDIEIAKNLRTKDNVILAVNKCDHDFNPDNLRPFKRLGIPKMVLVSAISGRNTGDLLDEISNVAKNIVQNSHTDYEENQEQIIRVSLIGRPNAGKSTLLNIIMGQTKMITSAVPGTTRDSQDFEFRHKGKRIIICDTAGIKRKSKVK